MIPLLPLQRNLGLGASEVNFTEASSGKYICEEHGRKWVREGYIAKLRVIASVGRLSLTGNGTAFQCEDHFWYMASLGDSFRSPSPAPRHPLSPSVSERKKKPKQNTSPPERATITLQSPRTPRHCPSSLRRPLAHLGKSPQLAGHRIKAYCCLAEFLCCAACATERRREEQSPTGPGFTLARNPRGGSSLGVSRGPTRAEKEGLVSTFQPCCV